MRDYNLEYGFFLGLENASAAFLALIDFALALCSLGEPATRRLITVRQ
jgi:hypothetical protein